VPKFGLVGYTNAGKSTLMNAITDAGVFVEDRLFATLDTTVRSFNLPGGQEAILSDTVGFIRKLPTNLVASFRSTLAEAGYADVLMHVVDVSCPNFRSQMEVVENTLKTLKIFEKPIVRVFNKTDCFDTNSDDYYLLKSIQNDFPDAVFISAKERINLDKLLEVLSNAYNQNNRYFRFILPYTDMDKLSKIYGIGDILSREEIDEGILLEVSISERERSLFLNNFAKFFKE